MILALRNRKGNTILQPGIIEGIKRDFFKTKAGKKLIDIMFLNNSLE